MRRLSAVLALAAALGLPSCSKRPDAAAAARRPATHTIVIEAMRFQPDTLTIEAGDTVVWENKDLVSHTATSKAGGFDSQLIEAGKSWQFTSAATGEFGYVCDYHPTMKGRLRIE